jgi:sigma-B regulation protein RsbU (phosphoserine phosphatase)
MARCRRLRRPGTPFAHGRSVPEMLVRENARQPGPPARTPRVLIADDQFDVLEALRLVLKDAGIETETVSSIPAVRERLQAAAYDLLLMDLNYARDTTSGSEGLELLAAVHEHDPLLPVIVMTGWGTIDTAVEAMRRGARTFIHKPWDNAALLDTVRREIADGAERRLAGARAKREHDDARLIQRALLPSSLPAASCCEVAVAWEPASDFGGDWYDAIALDGDRLGVSIGDVSGKGLPAAFLMANLQASFRAFAASHPDPGAVVASINRALCGNAALRTFATFFYGVVDCAGRSITYTNAGHNPPVLVRADGTLERLSSGGMVLGVFADAVYEQRQHPLAPGDRLVLFTDGLTDAENTGGEDFGDARLADTVRDRRLSSATDLRDAVLAAARTFAGQPFADDATLIAVAVG